MTKGVLKRIWHNNVGESILPFSKLSIKFKLACGQLKNSSVDVQK